MKNISLFLCLLLTATTTIFAQRIAEAPVAAAHEWPRPGSIARIDDSSAIKPGYLNDLSMAAVRDFTRRFTTAAAPVWFRLDNNGWVVKFKESNVKCQAAYNRKGSWTYTLREYDEKLLPQEVRHLVRSTYYDYAITGVTEVAQFNIVGPVYVLYMEDPTSFMVLTVHDGDMEIRETMLKAEKK